MLEQFGPEMQKRFYDDTVDAQGISDKSSITGKLKILDDILTQYHREDPDKPPLDAKQILRLYSSLTQDCYGFYSEVISRIQQGRVGKHSWVEGDARSGLTQAH